jgi:Protein of unknown function (DUF1501)
MRRAYPIVDELGISTVGRIGRELAETPLEEAWLIASPLGVPTFTPAGKALVMQEFAAGDATFVAKLWASVHRDGDLAKRALGKELARCNDCSSLRTLRDVVDRMSGTELPEPRTLEILLDDPTNAELAVKGAAAWCNLARDSAYLLEHGITRTIYCAAPHAFFDTHQNNLPGQRRSCLVFAEGFKLFLAVLRERGLLDDTAFVISSELGRNPFLNAAAGKDHFPHHPVILMGPGIQPGQYGHSDRTMGGLPISATTGHATTGASIMANLDDVGATILRWFELDPIAAGYLGRPLDFVRR